MSIIPSLVNSKDIPKRMVLNGYVMYRGEEKLINLEILNEFNEGIMSTKFEYVHPTVFTNLIKSHYRTRRRIQIAEDELYSLRVWSNVYRNRREPKKFMEYYLYKLAKKTLEVKQEIDQ